MHSHNEALSLYAEQHSRFTNERVSHLLNDLERATHLRVLSPQMLSGSLQGQWLTMMSELIQPRLVVEVGTFTGYSAICLAQGLAAGGAMHTIEYDEELGTLILEFLQKAELTDRVQLHLGDAKTIIPTLPDGIDLAFIDADKMAYAQYYDMLMPKMRVGGWLIIDNVLWHGKVLDTNPDAKTRAIDAFNKKVHRDNRVQTILLPIRDGLLIAKKIKD